MKLSERCLSLIVLTCMFTMGILNVFGQKNFASQLKASLETVEKEADKDPDTFKANMERMEKEWGERKNPVERSVVHAMLGSAYKQMKWTAISDFDEETRDAYDAKRDEHFGHVLDDVEALADAKASTYDVLLRKGKDSDLYGGDMLSVMMDFLEENASRSYKQQAADAERAWTLYRERGNLNGYGLMKWKWLKMRRELEQGDGHISYDEYKEALYQLLQEVQKEEIGADVALEYGDRFLMRDEEILFLKWALDHVGSSRRKGDLQRVLNQKLRPRVRMYIGSGVMANKPCKMDFSFWNCERTTLTIRKYVGRKMTKDGPEEILLTGDVVDRRDVTLAIDSVNQERKAKGLPVEGSTKTEVTLPAGRYVYVAEGLNQKTVGEVTLSTLRIIEADKDEQTCRLYVVDNETGRPVQGAKVQFRKKLPETKERSFGWESRGIEREVVTGKDGMVEIADNLYFRAVRSEEDYTDWSHHYNGFREPRGHEENFSCRVMTDRSIYRPGQKVMGSVLVYRQLGDEVKVMPETGVTITVMDAKWKKLNTIELVSNEYGTASFEIDLPEDCEVGQLSLQVDGDGVVHSHHAVRVEEYKRPTFSVSFGGNRSGHFGEVLEAEGTAMMFAGVPVQGAQVHYTVEYASTDFKRWWWDATTWNHMAEGDLVTDDEGKFRVPVVLTEEHQTMSLGMMRFRVKAAVTDMGGETHEATWTVNASDREFGLDVTVKEVVDMAKDGTFKVEAYDINHEKVDVKGTYAIKNGQLVVAEGEFASGSTIALPQSLKLGAHYSVTVTAYETKGRKVEDTGWFTPYHSALPVTEVNRLGLDEKRRAESDVCEQDFIYSEDGTFKEGGDIDLFFTTQETDAYIIYNVYNGKGLLEHQVGVTDGTMKHLRLHHQKEWGEGIQVDILYVRNGHYKVLTKRYELERPDKKLKLEWATFRDKLQPGQQEQWTLMVTDQQGKRVNGAEMMAVLYDASLDQIYSHSWNFWLGFNRLVPYVGKSCSDMNVFPGYSLDGKLPTGGAYTRKFDQLIEFSHDRYLRRGGARMLLHEGMVLEDGVMQVMALAKANTAETTEAADADDAAVEEEKAEVEEVRQEDFDNATIRENFAETAFFLPHLVSDKNGHVNVQFTLPESLTEWKFMGFAHTKDVDYGIIKATAVARKAFMLRPNMPRFLRWGDKAVIASSVVNQSEEALKGAVRLRLIDPKTENVVLTQEKPFAVEAGKTVGVDFGFDVQEDWTDLDCEIIAVSGNVSDGEKNPLPVLSTKKEMVESAPYYIIGNANGEVEKTIDLTRLYNQNSPTATHRVMKVEYTDNPAWMCIEALRSVKNPVEDDAIDYAASFYANTRMLELMKTFPVMEKYESVEELQQRVAKAEMKLKGLQMGDGGWSWFKGMNSSYYITLAVCEHLAKLSSAAENKMLKAGMEYLDKHELDAYNAAKKSGRKIWPSNSELRYLYLSAQMPERVVSKDVQKMRDEYLSLVEKAPRDLTIYGVANAAYALRAFGHVKSADKFVNFLKDYTVEKPGQGRFFATDAAYYSWMDYRIPTQVAAMKAICQKDKKDAILNDMQLWLLTQKQVQKWDNPMNTIDVADFLLRISPMETFHEAQKPVLSIDGQVLENMDYGTINTERDQLEGREANLVLQGNVLADVPSEMLEKGVTQLQVKKQTPSISWGAAYATFVEDVGNLNAYATEELKVDRKLYVQRAGSDRWDECKEGQELKVGDKLRIRHIITADRDMDFVRVSAQHPACLEPLKQLSGYRWMGGRGGYLSVHDSYHDLFFDWFTRGTATVDMEYYVVREGTYEMGVSTVECAYAKQFGGHTKGQKVKVKTNK